MSSTICQCRFNQNDYPELSKIFSSPLWDKYNTMFMKGGASRSVFLDKVKSDSGVQPGNGLRIRDIDLVIFADSDDYKNIEKDIESDPVLSGADIEFEDKLDQYSVEQYLDTRDTEANRAMIRPGILVYSTEAYDYLYKNLISSVTAYGRMWEYGSEGDKEYYKDNNIYSPRLAIRAVLQSLKENLEIPDEEYWVANEADDFNLAIHLFKAYEDNTQDRFVQIMFPALNRHGYMDTYDDDPDDVLVNICDYYAIPEGIYGIPDDYAKAKMNKRVHTMMEKEGITEAAKRIFAEAIGNLSLSECQIESLCNLHNSILEGETISKNTYGISIVKSNGKYNICGGCSIL